MEREYNLETLRQIQLIELDVLKEVHQFCVEHNLTYYLTMGSLLGAIRHGGFIPWDDDIDIDMPRKDYEIFIREFRKYKPEKYFVQNSETEKNYHNINFTKVKLNNTVREGYNVANIDMHKGIGIDVFPLDYVPDNEKQRKIQLFLVRMIGGVAFMRSAHYWDNSFKNKLLGVLLKPVSNRFLGRLIQKAKSLCRSSNTLCRTHFFKKIKGVTFDKEVYGEPVLLQFEDTKFYAPSQYLRFLTQVYGDYMKMPPENQRFNFHHQVKRVEF